MIAALLGSFWAAIEEEPERWLPQNISVDAIPNTINQTLTPTISGSRPIITINFPSNGTRFIVDSAVPISLTATDAARVTKVELRRFGYVLEAKSNPTISGTFDTDFAYFPRQSGRHILEFIAYNGTIQGDSTILELIVP